MFAYEYYSLKKIKYKSYFYNTSDELICMCSIIKEENLYIKDFIEHYKLLGYNHFYIYDNNDKNGEKLEDVISNEINSGLVSIIDFRGFRGKRGGPQMDAYYNCYEVTKNNCSWISFFDIDEYLIIDKKFNSLQELLNNRRYNICEGILVNWKVYHDSDLLDYKNMPIIQRFTGIKKEAFPKTSKLIARGKLSKKLKKSYSAHSLWYDIKLCNTLGKRITYKFWETPYSYEYMHLNHYKTKTISEYCRKIKKGNVYKNIPLTIPFLKERFNTFFLINNKTDKKVNIFNNFFNTSFKLI